MPDRTGTTPARRGPAPAVTARVRVPVRLPVRVAVRVSMLVPVLLVVAALALAAACAGGGGSAASVEQAAPPSSAAPGTVPRSSGASHSGDGSTGVSAAASDDQPWAPGGDATRVGQFVAQCPFSHRSPADPLVHPHGHVDHTVDAADPASSSPPHSHDFFGNSTTDEHSTIASLAASNSTTCDLVEDLSSYWAPTLSRDGEAVRPSSFAAYYDTAAGVDPVSVQPLPAGLAMIAGNDPRPGGADPVRAGWMCGKGRDIGTGVPACRLGAPLTLRIEFPDCWNGRDTDSADHREHVAYSRGGTCPPTHPVPIVRLVLSVRYPVYGDPSGLALSSGPLSTAHADFMNAWTEQGMQEFVDLCIRRRVICGVA